MVRDAIYNGVANKLDTLIEQLGKDIDEAKYQADKIQVKDKSAYFKQNNESPSAEKSKKQPKYGYETLKNIFQENLEAAESLIVSEKLPNEMSPDKTKWQAPQYELATMPNYAPTQMDELLKVELDLSQLITDQQFLSKAFVIEPVEFQLATARDFDFN